MDFGRFIRDQIPDQNGQTLPPDLTSGNQVANFTGTSQADLVNQYNTASQAYRDQEVNMFNTRRQAVEHEAYKVSDPIAPQYMIQNCGRL